jgi:ATP-dependent metalloprotease
MAAPRTTQLLSRSIEPFSKTALFSIASIASTPRYASTAFPTRSPVSPTSSCWTLSQCQQPQQQQRRRVDQQPNRAWIKSAAITQQQRRSFGSSEASFNGVPMSALASKEQAANRNPSNANAQNTFYQLLLKANRPDVIIERFESNKFAANAAAKDAYTRALQIARQHQHQHQQHTMAPQSLTPSAQAAAQAAAARQVGHDVSLGQLQYPQYQPSSSSPHSPASVLHAPALGSSSEPINVTTHESTKTVFARWFWRAAWFALSVYISMALVSLLVEYLMGGQKRPDSRLTNDYKTVKAESQKVRFTDVHGCDEAKDELQELVDFLRDPAKFSNLGGKLPKGVLLVGPPGTGKTLLARAVAGEAGVPFFYMSASEFDEVFVGVGARRVRDLFAAAKSKAPAIIFIDELDAMGGKRSARDSASNKQTLNQLLTELDGFDQNTNIIIIAATNFPQLLDNALTRPGRFDRHVTVPLPDVRGRIAILKHHSSKIKMDKTVNLDSIAAITSGLSGAELANIVNQAAVRASKLKAQAVQGEHFEWAKDKVIMGAEKKSMVISDKEKLMTAYHEAGHALMQLHHEPTSSKRKLYKVTILPRGMSLGHTAWLPEMDTYSHTANDMLVGIAVALGGKMAEELIYGDRYTTTGVSSDLDSATGQAFSMVTRYGMCKAIGPMRLDERYEYLSSETKAMIETEVQRLLSGAYEEVRTVLTARRAELDLLAKALVEYETLDRQEVDKILRGERLDRPVAAPGGKITVPISTVVEGGGVPDTGGAGAGGPAAGQPTPPPTPGGIITTPK